MKDKTIVFSLTCHESADCLLDFINNIIIASNGYKFYILISINNALYKELLEHQNKDKISNNIIIVTIRPDSLPTWGNINLFNQHILNIAYLVENNIHFDYFWILASNQLFIRKITDSFFDKVINPYEKIEISDSDIKEHFADYPNNIPSIKDGSWSYRIGLDTNLINYFKENRIMIYKETHESMVLPYNLTIEIYKEFTQKKIFENSQFTNYVLEEIFIPSYIYSKYKCKGNLSHNYFNWSSKYIRIGRYSTIIKNPDIMTVKRVNRDLNDPFRIFINNKFK